MFALSSAPVVLRALRAESVSTIPPFISTEPGPVAAFPLRTNFSKRAGRIEHNCEIDHVFVALKKGPATMLNGQVKECRRPGVGKKL
jgi:hypothetical protein